MKSGVLDVGSEPYDPGLGINEIPCSFACIYFPGALQIVLPTFLKNLSSAAEKHKSQDQLWDDNDWDHLARSDDKNW